MPAPAYVDTSTVQVPAVTVPRTPVSAAWGLAVRDNLEFLAKPPRCRVNRTAVQAINNNSSTAVIWANEEYDYAAGNFGGIAGGAMWAVGQPTRLVAPVAGTYDVKAGAQFAINATGVRLLYIGLNGVTIVGIWHGLGNSGWFTGATLAGDIKMAAGDYLELIAYHTAGAALNIDVSYAVFMSMRLVALT